MTHMALVQFLAAGLTIAAVGSGTAAAQTATPSPAAPAAAPPLADARWAPWIGCWRSVADPAGSGARLCVTPSGDGVATVTVVGGKAIAEDTRVADGRPRPLAAGDCTGTEIGRWSNRALRLYRTATVSCNGEPARTRSTASFFLNGPVWVDVETVSGPGDETSVRVARYERAYDQKLPDGTVVAAPAVAPPSSLPRIAAFTVDDVLELSTALPADGVQAAITEAPSPFRLNAKALHALADAGVGERVIDLMIGVTYPHKFVVDRLLAGGGGFAGGGGGGFGGGPIGFDPFFPGAATGMMGMMNCYAPLGWASSLYWTSCGGGYGFLNGLNPYGLYDPWNAGWVNLSGGGSGGSGTASPGVEGRVVNGRGYTQVRPVEVLPAIGGGSWSGASSTGDGGNSSGSGGSSGVSSSGYSGGGGGGGGGGERTAVPRPPGGGQ